MSLHSALQSRSFRPRSFRRSADIAPPLPSSEIQSPLELLESLGGKMLYARGAEIYGEEEPGIYLYKVMSGAVRSYKVLMDGRRQICDFHLRGDFFGLEADETHMLSAEAITDSTILLIKRSAVMALVQCDRHVAQQLWAMTNGELRRTHEHLLLLIKSATERVAAFLLEMATRMPTPDHVDLPMSRQDIADYLGLTIETVSRTLTDLENKKVISLQSSRRVVLRNRFELSRCSG
jgi:CRP/FNR family transcriptional regulator, nitrogen fixation regulation protein